MATQLATTERASPIVVLRQNLQAMAPELKMALPQHVTVEKFSRVAMTAVQNNPDLLNCDRKSLFGAIVRLAQDGLLPDGREAALVKFRTKENGQYVDKVQAMPMIAGVLKKIRQSGDVAKVSAHVVHENDHFVWKLGFDESVDHVPPALDQPRGRVIGAYAVAVLKDGSQLLEVMSLEEIEKVRAVSKSKDNQYGPWVQWFSEMARKTVMRRLAKRLPQSSDRDDDVFERDETLASTVIEHQAAEAEVTPMSRLDALEHQIASDAEPADCDDAGTTADPFAENAEAEPDLLNN